LAPACNRNLLGTVLLIITFGKKLEKNQQIVPIVPIVPGLPDGTFSNQKSKFGYILEGHVMKKVGIFYGHLECIEAIWYILWPFGNLVAIWCISPRFGILKKEISGNPAYV
jgi:hypothetical protein